MPKPPLRQYPIGTEGTAPQTAAGRALLAARFHWSDPDGPKMVAAIEREAAAAERERIASTTFATMEDAQGIVWVRWTAVTDAILAEPSEDPYLGTEWDQRHDR